MVNLFYKRLFGQIPSTEKFVSRLESLREEMERHKQFASNEKLLRYQELKALTESSEFQQKKQQIVNLKYKGSPEHQKESEYLALKKDKYLSQYLEVEQSNDLKRLETIVNSEIFFKYSELKKVIDSGEIEAIRKEMEQNYKQEFSLRTRLKELASNSKLKKYFKIVHSEDYLRFKALEDSPKISQYQILQKEVEAFNYKLITKENQQQYSTELENRRQLKQLENDPDIKFYLRFVKKGYPEMILRVLQSAEYGEYVALKEYLESPIHAEKIKEYTFETSEAAKVLNMFEEVKKSPEIQFYTKFTGSEKYKTYLKLKESRQVEEFKNLEQHIKSQEFQQRKSYLLDPRKWEKTEEFQLEQELLSLSKDPEIRWYFESLKKNKFAEVQQWELVFDDRFETLDSSKWLTIPFQGMQNLNGKSYVPEGNRQFHTNGKNLHILNPGIRIETRKEKFSGLRWQTSSGFKMRDFEYTSGILNTGHTFRLNSGKIEILAEMGNPEEVVHAAFLKSDVIAPHIDIFCTGTHKGFKARFFSNNQPVATFEETFKGIDPSQPFHYTLLWENNILEWQLNGFPIARYTGPVPTKSLYIGLSSVLLKEPSELPASFTIHSVKVFQRKQA